MRRGDVKFISSRSRGFGVRNKLKAQNIIDVNNQKYTYAIGTMYTDVINECEKLGDYVVNIVEARLGK